MVAAALCAVITLIAMQWLMAFDAANLVMLYLLGVVVVALFMDAGLRWLLPSRGEFRSLFYRPTRHARRL